MTLLEKIGVLEERLNALGFVAERIMREWEEKKEVIKSSDLPAMKRYEEITRLNETYHAQLGALEKESYDLYSELLETKKEARLWKWAQEREIS